MTTQDLLDRAQSIIDEIRSDAITPARMGELLRDIIALSDKRDVDITSLFDGMIYNVSQITGNYGLNASTARESVPINKRRLAQMVVYRTAQGTVAEMYNSSNIDGWKDQWNWITLAPVSRVSYLEAKLPIDRTNKIPGSNGETREAQTLRYVDPADVIHEIGIDQEGVPFVHSSGVYNRLVKDVELQAANESIENLRIDIFDNTINREVLSDGSENILLVVNDDADRTAGIGINSLSGKASVFKGNGPGRENKNLATEEYVNEREVEINKVIGYVREDLQTVLPVDYNSDGSSDLYLYNEDDGGSVSVLGVESKTGKVFSGRGWNPNSKPKKYLATEEYVDAREIEINKEIGYVREQLLETVPTSNNSDGSSDRYIYNEDDGGSVSVLGVESKTGKVFSGRGWNPNSKPKDYLATEEFVGAEVGKVADKNDQLEQDVNLLNRRPQGLRFKAQNSTVFAKTMKDLVLGTDDFTVCVVARMEGGSDTTYPIFGYSKSSYSSGSMRIYRYPSGENNSIARILMQNPINGGATENSVLINKVDATTNLHHIVITRSDTLVTCTVNGRLVKSVTQDRVLDFSNFIYDIASTSYFWGGYVFNYAMTQAESNRLLWNGGRYDESNINRIFNTKTLFKKDWGVGSIGNVPSDSTCVITNTGFTLNTPSPKTLNLWAHNIGQNPVGIMTKVSYTITNLGNGPVSFNFRRTNGTNKSNSIQPSETKTITDVLYCTNYNSPNTDVSISSNSAINIRVENVVRENCSCLLEYRPENIREDRYLNSGTMGADYDLIYSTVKPEIIFEKPYEDRVILDENKAPEWHPIAMGQEVHTPTNIFKAKLPTLGAEWSVSDWKQINNG